MSPVMLLSLSLLVPTSCQSLSYECELPTKNHFIKHYRPITLYRRKSRISITTNVTSCHVLLITDSDLVRTVSPYMQINIYKSL